MFYRRLGAVLAKVESVYGVDSNPEVANNSVLTTMAEITFNGEKLDRNVVKNNMSPIATPQSALAVTLYCVPAVLIDPVFAL